MSLTFRPLSERPLNDNYQPPRPWECMTPAAHTCAGQVVGFVGAYPVCQPGADAEIAAWADENARWEALAATPEWQQRLAREAAAEQAWEGRVS